MLDSESCCYEYECGRTRNLLSHVSVYIWLMGRGTSLGDSHVGVCEHELGGAGIQCEAMSSRSQGDNQHHCAAVEGIASCHLHVPWLEHGC